MDFAAGLVDLAVVGDPPLTLLRRQRHRAAPDIGRRVIPMAPFGRGRDALAERTPMGQQA